jgi:F0F1-type ATP synthase delta subunit
MKARHYAEALYRAAHAHNVVAHGTLVERFVALLTGRGHARLLPSVVREYEKIVHERSSSEETHVRVARASDTEKYKKQIEHDLTALNAHGRPTNVTVDESVVGGYSLEANGTRIDRTYKQALVELYSSLTNS